LEGKALDRLIEDLAIPVAPSGAAGDPAAEHAAPRAAAASRIVPPDQPALRLTGEILQVAEFFVERVEFLPYEVVTWEQILDELSRLAQEASLDLSVVTALGSLQHIRKDQLVEKVYHLPVFPLVALKALEQARCPETDAAQVESLVSSDQVLAGRLIQAANSALNNPLRPISSLRQAIAHIGLEAACKALIAAVFHPLFASVGLHSLWRHSLEVSDWSARLASQSAGLLPEEAFLAGLVHDVGRLALQTTSAESVIAYTRMLEKGCEPVFAEMVLCGFDHGEAGADILNSWSFPEHLVQAVHYHHQPEHCDSALASLLYLAEFWSGSDEDMPSAARLRSAQKRVGLSPEQLSLAPARRSAWLDALASAR
jgi:putative nucleotidyltransferase with HDIG domain